MSAAHNPIHIVVWPQPCHCLLAREHTLPERDPLPQRSSRENREIREQFIDIRGRSILCIAPCGQSGIYHSRFT